MHVKVKLNKYSFIYFYCFFNREKVYVKKKTYRNIAIDSSISRSTETSVIVKSRLVLAHSPLGTRVVGAIRLLLLAVDTGIPVGALAPVVLR